VRPANLSNHILITQCFWHSKHGKAPCSWLHCSQPSTTLHPQPRWLHSSISSLRILLCNNRASPWRLLLLPMLLHNIAGWLFGWCQSRHVPNSAAAAAAAAAWSDLFSPAAA
jgi:hypothetical protein